MSDTKVYPKCIYMSNGERCAEDAVHDGLCGTHVSTVDEAVELQHQILSLLVEFKGVDSEEVVAGEIMNRIIARVLDNHANVLIAQKKTINMQGEIQRKRTLEMLTARALLRKQAEREDRLRSDFGELAKDLKKVVNHLAPPLGGDQHPVHGRWLMELHSWRATAEILADKEFSDNLDEIRKAPIEDFGSVPRPEWRCHLHPNAEPMQRLNGTKICSDGMCIQAEGD
jgi:hypothetical protein